MYGVGYSLLLIPVMCLCLQLIPHVCTLVCITTLNPACTSVYHHGYTLSPLCASHTNSKISLVLTRVYSIAEGQLSLLVRRKNRLFVRVLLTPVAAFVL
jgi:hypothetical protein